MNLGKEWPGMHLARREPIVLAVTIKLSWSEERVLGSGKAKMNGAR
jgi:hypothetical protein